MELLADPLDEVYRALTLGVRDYVEKNGFEQVVIGLSGGIDSALTAVIAVDALGANNVLGVFMPSPYTSRESREDTEELARRLGIELKTLPITPAFKSYLETLKPAFDGTHPDTTEENLQARIRGNLLMALSNKFGHLVLTTGNKSEMSVGYATLYGDMSRAGKGESERSWIDAQLKQFPERYVYGTGVARIAAHLAAVRRLHRGDVIVETDFNRELGVGEYTVITHDDLTPGIFSKIAGVMAGSGLQILDAQILTRADGIIVDTFQVTDLDYQGAPPTERRQTVGDRIAAVLKGWEHVDDVLRRGARLKLTKPLPKAPEATEVRIDNETSESCTIIDVFADDRQGLLHVITNAMFQLGLSIHAARISTRLDQVADVFYVTDPSGRKVSDHGHARRR